MRYLVSAILGALLVAPPTRAAESMTLDGIEVSLSLTKTEVEKLFPEELYFPLGDSDPVFVVRKPPSAELVALLFFKRGRLAEMHKTWKSVGGSEEADALFNAIFGLLVDLNQRGLTIAQVDAGERHEYNSISHHVWIRFGSRSIHIHEAKGEVVGTRFKEVVVSEVLAAPALPKQE